MILAQDADSHNTLQVRLPDTNEWMFVEPIPGAFICNVADMMATWTNGIYRSTPHRVIPPRNEKGRISIPFFYDPSYDAVIAPIDELVQRSGRPPSFEPIRYGDHLYAKTSNNFVFDQEDTKYA